LMHFRLQGLFSKLLSATEMKALAV
jgi:hypothetical protein